MTAKISQINGGVAVAIPVGSFIEYENAGGTSGYSAPPFYAVDGATVATNQAVTSATYTDLTTAGPAVTMTTGTSVIITISASVAKVTAGAGNTGFISFAVSGATTLAASDANSSQVSASTSGSQMTLCRRFKLTGLTAGSNTFTMKYRSDGNNWTWQNRSIVVEAI